MYYGNYSERYERLINSAVVEYNEVKVTNVINGVIFPLRLNNNECYGGVVDSDYNFIAGYTPHPNKRTGICKSWDNEEIEKIKIDNIDETVVYGGVLYTHFGHLLSEGLSRFWYLCENIGCKHKIIFLLRPGFASKYDYSQLLDLIGIDKSKYLVLETPTRFAKIIVPDQSYFIDYSSVNVKSRIVYDFLTKNSLQVECRDRIDYPDKVYLSRTRFIKNDGVNEQYFENFYKSRGYSIIYPEQLSLSAQINLLSHAKHVVCTAGTLTFLLFFCKEKTKVTILLRDDLLHESYFHPLLMNDLDFDMIEANFNFLPHNHYKGNLFLYGPTKHFINFLRCKEIDFLDSEVSLDDNLKPFIYDYVILWAEKCTNKHFYNAISNQTVVDIIKWIYVKLLDKSINVNNLQKIQSEKNNLVFRQSIKSYISYFNNLEVLTHDSLEFDYNFFANSQRVFFRDFEKNKHYEIIESTNDFYIALHIEDSQCVANRQIIDWCKKFVAINNTFNMVFFHNNEWLSIEKRIPKNVFRSELSGLIYSTLIISSAFKCLH